MRSENGWSIDLQSHTVTAATHDDDDTVVVADDETYETHYGLRDPMLRTQIGMFRPIRMDHTNCLQVAIKTLPSSF